MLVVMVPTAIATTPTQQLPVFPQGNVAFPLPCPMCLAPGGHPISVRSAGLDRVEVHMKCRCCSHAWAYLRQCHSLRL
jgi:hypothetical protein